MSTLMTIVVPPLIGAMVFAIVYIIGLWIMGDL